MTSQGIWSYPRDSDCPDRYDQSGARGVFRYIDRGRTYEVYHRLRRDVLAAYLSMPYAEFSAADRGTLFNTLERETWNVAEAVQCAFRIAVNVAPTVVFAMILIAIDWKVGFGIAIAGSFVVGLLALARSPSRQLAREAQSQNENSGCTGLY